MIRFRLSIRRALLAAGLLPAAAIAQTNTLNSYTTTGGTNFAAPVAPNAWTPANPGAGSATADVRVNWLPGGFGHTVNNDTGAAFDVNVLRLHSYVSGTASLGTAGAGSVFNFTGTAPQINLSGWGTVGFSPGTLSTATAPVIIRGTGHGDVSLNGIAGLAGDVTMAASSGLVNSQIFTYSVAGGGGNATALTLNSGNLRLSASSVGLGGVTSLTVNGGNLNLNAAGSTTYASAAQINVPVTLNGTLTQTGGSTTTTAISTLPFSNAVGQSVTYTTGLSGSGGYTLAPTIGGSVTSFRGDASYTGATTLRLGSVYGVNLGTIAHNSNLIIDGVNGGAAARLSGTSGIILRDGSVFTVLNNTGTVDRVNDSASLTIHGGSAYFTTGSATAYSETLGNLIAASGTGTITAGNAGTTTTINGTNVGVTFGALNRTAGDGMLFVRGGTTAVPLGSSATSARVLFASAPANVAYAGAPGGTVGVLPAIVAGAAAGETGATTTSGAFGLATYGANGVRPLALAEYGTNLTASGAIPASNGNVRLNAATGTFTLPVGSDAVMNALFINPASGATAISAGATTERIVFPADSANLILINQSQSTTVNAAVDFGGEGKIYAANNASNTSGPNFNGVISGTGGLTVGGPGGINLGAANTVSGTLAIAGSRVGLSNSNNLQNITAITAGGGASVQATLSSPTTVRPRLQFNSPAAGSSLNLPQSVELRSGLLEVMNNQLSTANNSTITMGGVISGEGGLLVNTGTGGVTGAMVRLTGTNNTYSGQTRVFSGTLAISGDGALGNTSVLDLASGSTGLLLEGNWTSAKQINFTASGTINTNGNNATLSGSITSTGAAPTDTFFKTGAGDMNLTGSSPLNMNVTVDGGSLRVNGEMGPGGTLTVRNGSSLGGSGVILKNTVIGQAGVSTGIVTTGNSIGTLTFGGSVTFNAGTAGNYSSVNVEIASATNYDQIRVFGADTNFSMGSNSPLSGTATSNVTLNATNTGSLLLGDVIWLVVNDAPVSGTADGTLSGVFRNAGGLITDDAADLVDLGGGYKAAISYNGDFDTLNPRAADNVTVGNDIALIITAVPEPSTAGYAGLIALALLRRRRR